MQIKFLFLFLLISHQFIFSQENLLVEYEITMEFDVEKFLQESGATSGMDMSKNKDIVNPIKDAMSKPSYYTLTVNPTTSLFESIEVIDNSQPSSFSVTLNDSNPSYFKDLTKNLMYEIVKFQQTFLVEDSLQNFDWKITNEEKEIVGYKVRKSETKIDSTRIITAWYAPKLAFKNGPMQYGGLPGLILEMEIIYKHKGEEKSTTFIKPKSIQPASNKKKVEFPKKGKVISRAEFDQMMKEQMEKWKDMEGENVIINFDE